MAINTFVPEQRSGEAPQGVRTEPLVVDESILELGDEEGPPLRSVLNAIYGEHWRAIPHKASKSHELFAAKLRIAMFEIEVVDEGQPRVLQQPVSQTEVAPKVGAHIPRQFQGSGEDRILLERSDTLALNRTTLAGPRRRDFYTDIYGPETAPDQLNEGGWFVKTDLPRSDVEHVRLHMEIEPLDVYVTLGGLKRAVER